MATETLILRPNRCSLSNGDSSAWFPTETDETLLHTLLNESVTDDDATYIGGNVTYTVNFYFDHTLIPNDKVISDIRLVIRCKLVGGTSYTFNGLVYAGASTENFVANVSSEDTWETFSFLLTNDKYYTITDETYIMLSFISSNKTTVYPYFTQLYIEVDLEDILVYTNQDSAWNPVHNAFKKESGVWNRIYLDECSNVLRMSAVENNIPIINFQIGSGDDYKKFSAQNGMTWAEWCDSVYNDSIFYIHNGYVAYSYSGSVKILQTDSNIDVAATDIISENHYYYCMENLTT